MIVISKSLAAVLLATLVACTRAPDQGAGQDPSESPQTTAPTNRIDIPATVRRNLGLTFAQVESRQVAQTIRIPGAFELQPLARHEYRMALPGRVELLVDQLDRVEAGQVLFRFQSSTWPELLHEIILGEQDMHTAQAQIAAKQAMLKETRGKLAIVRERIEGLAQSEFKNAELDLQATELELSLPRMEAELRLTQTHLANAMRTREHALHRAATAGGFNVEELEAEVMVDGVSMPAYSTIDWIEVPAVHSGVVEMLAVTDGAFVETPSMVLATVDPSMLRFRAMALQADLHKFTNSTEARIVPPLSPGVSIEDGVEATLTFGLEAHSEARTLTLFAQPADQAQWIRPGISAFLEVVIESTEAPALAVPRSAVVQDGLMHVLFRRDPADANKAIRIEADMGVSDGRWVALNSGVRLGDEVVLDGVYELKLATQQSGANQSGGHFHADGAFHDDH